MTLRDDIVTLQARITKAGSDGEAWRASGHQEKYLEAVSTADALEVRIEQLHRTGARNMAGNFDRASVQLVIDFAAVGARSDLAAPRKS